MSENNYGAFADRIKELKSQVIVYQRGWHEVKLPFEPDGRLAGVAFCYDEDFDDRVLLAIKTLNAMPPQKTIFGVYEHEGIMDVYSDVPLNLTELQVADDLWQINNLTWNNGDWGNEALLRSHAWLEPATDKQINYLRSLGYHGASPKTKGEAGRLFRQYRQQA